MVQPSNWIFCLPTFTLKRLVLSVLKLDTADFVLRHLRNCWNFHAPQMILLRPGRRNAASADHCRYINSLPNDKNLDQTKLKTVADDILNVAYMLIFVCDS